MSFRKFQALFDLRSAALGLLVNFPRDLTSSEISVHNKFVKLSSDKVPQWNLELRDDFWTSLVHASCSPDKSRTEFLFATCMLTLDRFENPQRGGDFEWEWDEFSEIYRNAPAPIRAALMNGLKVARDYSLVSEEIRPTSTELITNSTEDILAPLIALARALTPEERAEISKADYGCDVSKHFATLNALLETKNCRFPDTWFPAEVVELNSYGPENTGFVGCTALVLINAIDNGDYNDSASYRWSTTKIAYQNLGLSARQSILTAFRHLYETKPDWDPFWVTFAPERLPHGSYIQWLSDQSKDHIKRR